MFPYSFNNIYGYLRFNNMYMSSPAIEDKLKRANCSIEDLLEEEEIIQEMKNQNAKLLSFFENKENVKNLIDYIILEPEEDDHRRGHKYPFIASELLNCDVNKINDFFILTEGEMETKERKVSSVSNNDSDMVLSAEDHYNAFNQNLEDGNVGELAGRMEEVKIEEHFEEGEAEDDAKEENDDNEEEENVKLGNPSDTNQTEDENVKLTNHSETNQTEENVKLTNPSETNQTEEEYVDLNNPSDTNHTALTHPSETNQPEEENTTETKNNENTHKYQKEANAEIGHSQPIVANPQEIQISPNEFDPKEEYEPETINKNKIELLDHLLSFLETEKELNFVLVGYFAKFFNLLINKFPHKILTYIYIEKPETLGHLIFHSSKKSIADLISKIMLVENFLPDKEKQSQTPADTVSNSLDAFNSNLESILEIRRLTLINLFLRLNVEDRDTERISNIALILNEVVENKTVLETIVNERTILEHVFAQLAKSAVNELNSDGIDYFEYNYNEILNVLINIIRFVQVESLKTPSYASQQGDDIVNSSEGETGKLENTLLGEIVLKEMKHLLKNFPLETRAETTNKIDNTFNKPFSPLGSKRVKIVELVSCFYQYFKNIQSLYDRELIRADFFKHLIDFFFLYEWNNIYQLNFENIFKHLITNAGNHLEIIKLLFEDMKILEIFIERGKSKNRIEEDGGFSFNSSRKVNNGYFAVLVEISHRIYLTQNQFIRRYFTEEFEYFVHTEVNAWKRLFERRLCAQEVNIGGQQYGLGIEHISDFNSPTPTQGDSGEDPKEEEIDENQESNPFANKKDLAFFDMGNENDDWLNPKKTDENDMMLDNINDFEFVDDQKTFLHERKISREDEAELLRDTENNKLKVDEIEDSYNDAIYWKNKTSTLKEDDILNELNL